MIIRLQALVRVATIGLPIWLASAASPMPLFAQNSATIHARANVVPRIVYQAGLAAANMAAWADPVNHAEAGHLQAPYNRRELAGGALLVASYHRSDHPTLVAISPRSGTGGRGVTPVSEAKVEVLYIAN
ncbi:MAG: hypothetical protein KatS3mg081_1650 [Gemmatimonadales bacterium]|nr:MAG: hypothetical protein KatS3mg081_1650 [Gemmatimonadales bacterium]